MKTFYTTLNYINYIFTSLFLLLSFLGGVLRIGEAHAYALYIAFFLGIFQIVIALLVLINWKHLKLSCRTNVLTYLLLVVLYFVLCFVLVNFFKELEKFIIILAVSLPIFLSIFFTYLLRKITLTL